MTKDAIADYLNLPYTITLRQDEDGDWVGHIKELEGCAAHGQNQAEALANLREVQEAWIHLRLETGKPIPEPEPEEVLPSGKWLQRVPRSLHRALIELAKREDTSLNSLVTSMLSEAVATSRLRGRSKLEAIHS